MWLVPTKPVAVSIRFGATNELALFEISIAYVIPVPLTAFHVNSGVGVFVNADASGAVCTGTTGTGGFTVT